MICHTRQICLDLSCQEKNIIVNLFAIRTETIPMHGNVIRYSKWVPSPEEEMTS